MKGKRASEFEGLITVLDCYTKSCSKCPGKRRIVPGGGPIPSRVIGIGEAPGQEEDRKGVAFTGKAGQELDHDFLPRAGLDRGSIYITNTVLCRPDDNRKPDDWIPGLAESCARHHLISELDAVKPELIVLMGATACELVQGDRIDLELDHGIVQRNVLFGREVWVFPTYHPALGLHDGRAIKNVREDFERLGMELYGVKTRGEMGCTRPVDKWPGTDYGVMGKNQEDWDFLGAVLDLEKNARHPNPLLAVDTETDGRDDEDASATPYSIQVSAAPGWARWIYANDKGSIGRLNLLLEEYKPGIVFHNAGFDLPVSADMGVDLYQYEWTDTMLRAFHLARRHGLKTLGWRLAGVRMKTFEELVRPNWEREAWRFLEWARLIAEGGFETMEPRPVVIRTGKRKGETQLRRPMSHYTRINRMFLDRARGKHKVLPGERWEKLPENVRREVEEACGETMPPFSIRYADKEEAVEYGCRDADVTLRVHLELERGMEKGGEGEWAEMKALRKVTKFDTDDYGDLLEA